MAPTEGSLPLRKDGQIETRPMHVEEWLETLPYADFQRTSQLLHETIAATNKVTLKPSVRQELRELYDQPYRYYLQSQIKTGARHTLASMESMQQQLRAMKQLATDMALMTQLVINDTQKNKSLWGSKPPLPATQQAIAYLSQALIFNFLEYGPTPRNIWKQLHSLYRFAESLGKLHDNIPLADGDSTTIARHYCCMVLTEVVDPYHLPFGGIWEVYDQVASWTDRLELQPFSTANNPGGLFVIDLYGDSPAQPYNRFDAGNVSEGHRLLDAGALYTRAEQLQKRLLNGDTVEALKLSDNYRRLLIGQMIRAWNLPPKRYFPRTTANGELAVSCGLQATHVHMNGDEDLIKRLKQPHSVGADGLDVEGENEPAVDSRQQTGSYYALESWNLINKSAGGCALSRKQRPMYSVHVGDLLGLRLAETDSGAYWRLGIIRWLMIDDDQGYRIGVQLLGAESEPVALYVNDRREPRHGFRVRNNGEASLVAARGLLAPNQTIKVVTASETESLQTSQLIEEMAGFEQFSVQPR